MNPLPVIDSPLTRDTPFSYTCNACNRCCYDKRIHVNPYEVARIAQTLRTTTTDVIARYTENDGTSLAVRENGACVFLDTAGCSVHAGRPLACRLYPLGRVVLHDETEMFVNVRPHPQSLGMTGARGTVGSWIESQDVQPYLIAARAYRVLLSAWVALVRKDADARIDYRLDARVLDVDACISSECADSGVLQPEGVEARVRLHIAILEEAAAIR